MSTKELCDRIITDICGTINQQYQKLRTTQYKQNTVLFYGLVIGLLIFLGTALWSFTVPETIRWIGYGLIMLVVIVLVYQTIVIFTS